jgi:hypothetical protein
MATLSDARVLVTECPGVQQILDGVEPIHFP